MSEWLSWLTKLTTLGGGISARAYQRKCSRDTDALTSLEIVSVSIPAIIRRKSDNG